MNGDGKTDVKDVFLFSTMATSLFNAILNVITILGLGITLTSNNTPVLNCVSGANSDGKQVLSCTRPTSVGNTLNDLADPEREPKLNTEDVTPP